MINRSCDNITDTSRSALPSERGVGIPQETVTTPEDALVPATVLRPEAVDWTVADYNLK